MKPFKLEIPEHLLPHLDESLFLAISGGVDSMALLHVCLEENLHPTVLHVNYRLRGADSDADEALIVKICLEKNLRYAVYRVSDKELKDLKKGNLQEKARNIRYEFFRKEMSGRKAVLMTAHHQDDQVETFFIRLFRKAGLLGLQGIQAKSGQLIRPFLAYSKEQIRNYAKMQGWNWREDISNQSSFYLRNKLRLDWIPLMTEMVPDLKESILLLTQLFQEENDRLYRRFENDIQEIKKKKFWSHEHLQSLTEDEVFWLGSQVHFKANEIQNLLNQGDSLNSSIVQSSYWGPIRKTREGWSWQSEKEQIPSISLTRVEQIPTTFSKQILYLDESKIKGKLTLRKTQEKDRIESVGVLGSQLVSKIMKDAKLEANQKDQTWVLVDDERILWVYGLKISRVALAHPETKDILKVELKFRD